MLSLILTLILQAPISYETKAVRVPVLLEALSKTTKQKLGADSAFHNEVLVVRAEGVSPRDLLDRIAHATSGRWESDRGTLVLKPDGALRAKQESERLERRQAKIQAMLDQYALELKSEVSQGTLDAALKALKDESPQRDYYASLAHQRLSPLARLGMKVLLALGAKKLSTIERGQRPVFCSNPNSLQVPMPGGDKVLAQFAREHEILETAMSGWDQSDTYRLRGFSWSVTRDSQGQRFGPIGRVWVSVGDVLRGGGVWTVNVGMESADGKQSRGDSLNLQVRPATPATYKVDHLPDVKLNLDPESIELGQAYTKKKPLEATSPVRKLLLDPRGQELLALGSELYLQYAKARKVNLVALINDNSFLRFLGMPDSPVTVRTFEQRNRPSLNFEEADGWVVITPNEPAEARRSRHDRGALAALFKDANDGLSLEGKAAFLLSRPYGLANGIGVWIATILDPEVSADFETQEDGYRLFATMSPAQRRSGGIAFGALSAGQRALVNRSMFGDPPHLQRATSQDLLLESNYLGPTAMEPSELVPDGVPPGAILKIADDSLLDVRLSYPDNRSVYGGGSSIEAIAKQLFWEQNPQFVKGDLANWVRPSRFQALSKRRVSLILTPARDYAWAASLVESRPQGAAGTIDQLPEAHRKAINGYLEAFNKQRDAGHPPTLMVSPPRNYKPPPSGEP